MTAPWTTVRDRVADRTDRILAELRAEWESDRAVDPFELGPRSHDPAEPPTTLRGQLELCSGIASAIVFYTAAREETVLVYNPAGHWEPPGGVVEAEQTPEEAATVEAREETGLEIELTDLLYAGRFRFRYASGESAPLPVAQFVGHRVGGSLRVEREGTDHPGATRATGLFDADVLPDACRDVAEVRRLLADPTDDSDEK